MRYVFRKNIFIFLILTFISVLTFAAPKTTTFQIRIKKPDGTNLEAGTVKFRFTSLSASGTCVLYVEDFDSVDMSALSGGLAVLNLGKGTQVFTAASTADYSDIFNNLGSGLNCQGGGIYNPAKDDRRRIVVQFNDNSGAGWQSLPAIDINSVPYANYAGDSQKFSGKEITDFILSSALPNTACGAGQVLTYTGTAFSCVAAATGSGSVTSVASANSFLTVATGTTTAVITANVGTAANTLAAGNDARIVGAAQKANNLSDLTSVTSARTNLGLGTAAVTNTGTASGNIPVLDGAGKLAASVLPNSLVTSSTALTGDVTGTVDATVVSAVGAKTAAQVSQSVTDTQAATASNTANTLVKRDVSGSVSFGDVATTNISSTSSSTKNAYLYDTTSTHRVLVKAASGTDYTMILPTTIGSPNQIIGYDSAGAALENKTITAGAGVSVTHTAGGILISATDGGTVSSVTSANTDIGVATTTSTPVLTLNSGTSANQIVKLDTSARMPAVDGSALTNLDATHLAAAVPINKGGTNATTATAALNNLLPTQVASPGKFLQTDGTNTSWVSGNSGTVTNVTSANSYLTIATGSTTPALTVNVGTAANTLAAGNDSRIVNAIQQSAYNGDIANVLDTNCATGSTAKWSVTLDAWTCVAIGSLNASAITSGTVATARLGSGTADATTYLRGDGSWAAVPAGSGGAATQPTAVFLTSGTSWTSPAAITTSTSFKITVIGGGGGGGGAKYGSSWTTSAGGGAGGVIIWWVSGLNPSTAYTIAIGAAGTAGAATPTNGGNGGNTSITINGTTVTAGGGGGGASNTSGSASVAGGAGGTVSGGTIQMAGQAGKGSYNTVGNGGSGQFGMGGNAPPSGSGLNSAGTSATGFGGGGSGAMAGSNPNSFAGGAGSAGAILIEWQQ